MALLIAASTLSLKADTTSPWNWVTYGYTELPGRYFGTDYVAPTSITLMPEWNYRFALLGKLSLPNIDLHRINGEGIWFRGSDLSGSNFAGANLQGADFGSDNTTPGADLTNAYMVGASLREADLTGVTLSTTILRYANLVGVWFDVANMYKVDFTGANLSYARVPFENWADFLSSNNIGLDTYLYDPNAIIFTGRKQSIVYDRSLRPDLAEVPEPSTYGLIGIGALAVAIAARRRKLKTA